MLPILTALAELEKQLVALANRISGTTRISCGYRFAEQTGADQKSSAQHRDDVSNGPRGSINEAQDQETSLRENLRRTVVGSSLSADILTEIYDLQQNAELARNQYQLLLSRAQDLEAQANLQVPDSRVVYPALAPATLVFLNWLLIMALASLVSAGLGIALANSPRQAGRPRQTIASAR